MRALSPFTLWADEWRESLFLSFHNELPPYVPIDGKIFDEIWIISASNMFVSSFAERERLSRAPTSRTMEIASK